MDKEYHHKYNKNYYLANKKYFANKRDRLREERRKWFREYKSNLCCKHCGESRPVCLEFHHKDKTAKEITIAEAIHRCWSIQRIEEEISKCEILCANCHRIEHNSEWSNW